MRVRLFQKYILIDLLKIIALLVFIFGGFYILIDFFEKLGDFLKFKKPFYLFLSYIFWKLWVNIYEIYPFIIGLSGIFCLLWLNRTNELLAFLSLGFSKKEILRELSKGLLIISILGGLILNLIFPKAAFMSLYTWDYKIESQKKQYLIFDRDIFFAGNNYYLIAKPLEPKGEYLKNIILVFLDKEDPKEIWWIDSGYYIDKTWVLSGVIIQKKELGFKPEFFTNIKTKLPFKPSTLVTVEKPIEFLSFSELIKRYRFLKKVKRPYDDILAEIFLKIFYLFLPFILGFLPMHVYLEEFAPSKMLTCFSKSLSLYFIFLCLFLLLQTFLRKGFLFASIILIIWSIIIFVFFIFSLKKNK
ncbi:LptF/LptG family permease [Thermodesulfobacterium hydrogeniphilum]|uniref:LptF/LptG family permease n=1 Tax=Thermodesulfobacterium hydrogeniphilum TaxID=161156 RepID=UPI00056DB105|nr:LptF/LptG family permease [Thermodesulfobacterium hydrogeniphilum]